MRKNLLDEYVAIFRRWEEVIRLMGGLDFLPHDVAQSDRWMELWEEFNDEERDWLVRYYDMT
jgi:hypothetical protein